MSSGVTATYFGTMPTWPTLSIASVCRFDAVHVARAQAAGPAAVVGALGAEVRAVHRVVRREHVLVRVVDRGLDRRAARDAGMTRDAELREVDAVGDRLHERAVAASYTVIVCRYIMFCANTSPVPVAVDRLRRDVAVDRRDVREREVVAPDRAGLVVVVVGGAVVVAWCRRSPASSARRVSRAVVGRDRSRRRVDVVARRSRRRAADDDRDASATPR